MAHGNPIDDMLPIDIALAVTGLAIVLVLAVPPMWCALALHVARERRRRGR